MFKARTRARLLAAVLGIVVLTAAARAAPPKVDASRLARIDDAVSRAVERGQLPGAVVLVQHKGDVVYRKALGRRSREPAPIPMTAEAVFDVASLTKPVATAASVFVLVDQGKLRLSDRAARHWPEFGRHGKDRITVEHLLLHTSGLPAGLPLSDFAGGREKALARICDWEPKAAPGETFVYSDIGYIVLGELVGRVAGMPLDAFARRHLFEPLGMRETTFRPGPDLRKRAAPTTKRGGEWIVGEVHDPRAHLMGGVAGHAGLFSTADDLAVFGRMLLRGGEHNGKRILSPESVRAFTTARPVPRGLRTPGWDADTAYSRNRGRLFPRGASFGHTGFTGTSIWIDPGSDTLVVFLSNRVHPDESKGDVTRLRGEVATFAAEAVSLATRAGIDVLVRENFARLKGRRVGLVTNHTGLDRDGNATIDLLHKAPGLTLVALFSPEHGIRGDRDEVIGDSKDLKTGLPVFSLYGKTRKPSAESLKGIDTLVFDIQDAGCRFYTYISTLGLVMEAAAEHKLRVVVLDRPNPIGGLGVEGPLRDDGRESFVAFHRLPVRHGMTVGELARMFNAERKGKDGRPLGCDLEVVKMDGWRRGDFFDRTNLTWVSPSPNLRGLTAALLYPGIGLLETTNVSVGRGTDRPFEWVGAPWIDGRKLAAALAGEELPGLRVVPLRMTPAGSVHQGKACGGVQLIVDDWARFRPVRTGLALASALRRLYPDDWKTERFDVLLCHRATWDGVRRGDDWRKLEEAWQPDATRFRERRRPYLLYPE